MIDITSVVSAIITLLCALITSFVVPWLKQKISEEKFRDVYTWVQVAVEAAEQLYKSQSGAGESKKSYVKEFLNKMGYDIDSDEIDTLIESAVLQLQ